MKQYMFQLMGVDLSYNILGEINPWPEDTSYTGTWIVCININRNCFLDTQPGTILFNHSVDSGILNSAKLFTLALQSNNNQNIEGSRYPATY